eukprot:649973-Hanusia_phi.AAC.1
MRPSHWDYDRFEQYENESSFEVALVKFLESAEVVKVRAPPQATDGVWPASSLSPATWVGAGGWGRGAPLWAG